MKMKNIILFAFVSMVFISSAVFAVPGIPNQFFGTVSINGAPASDGTTVSAKINGATVSTTQTAGGKYGYSPNIFYVDDPNSDRVGDTIYFFVNGIDSGATAYFSNGKSTQLNLAITMAVPLQQASSSSSGGSGGGGSTPLTTVNNSMLNSSSEAQINVPSSPCTEYWTCEAWSECKDGVQRRLCKDTNKCGTIEDLPMTSQPCSKLENSPDSSDASKTQVRESGGLSGITGMFSAISSGAGYAAGLIILAGLIAYYFYSKKSENNMKPVKRELA